MPRQFTIVLPDDLAERLTGTGEPSVVVTNALRRLFAQRDDQDPTRKEAARVYAEIREHRTRLRQ